MLFQQQRDARRHGIAGLDHILDKFLRLAFKATGHGINDGRTALVDAERVDVLGGQFGLFQQLVQVRRHFKQREVEHLAAIHKEHAITDFQMRGTGTVGAELGLLPSYPQLPDVAAIGRLRR